MTTQDPITRTCVACGFQKPLSAFLQISGTQGTTYGTICSTCRGAGITEKKHTLSDEERGSTASSFRIGSKQKIEIEKEHKRQQQEAKEHHLDKEKRQEKTSSEQSEKTEDRAKAEKLHRETYIDARKKAGFLQNTTVRTPSTPPPVEQQAIEQKEQQEKIMNEAAKLTSDASGSPVLLNTISRDNPMFRQFAALLSSDAPVRKTMTQFYNTNKPAAEKPNEPKQANEKEKDPLNEYVNKTWGPSSRKR